MRYCFSCVLQLKSMGNNLVFLLKMQEFIFPQLQLMISCLKVQYRKGREEHMKSLVKVRMWDVHLKCSASRAFYNEKNCRPTINTVRLHWMCSRQTNSVGVKQISKRMKNKMRKMRESLYSFNFLKKIQRMKLYKCI